MARKTLRITVTAEGRDKGKLFTITEMSAAKAERWATKALLILARSGVDFPEQLIAGGIASVASIGMRAFAGVEYQDLQPILDEMMLCVSYTPDPSRPMVVRETLLDDDIEELTTRLMLRAEIFKLHTDFLKADSQPELTSSEPNK